jgi:hypothetical protein
MIKRVSGKLIGLYQLIFYKQFGILLPYEYIRDNRAYLLMDGPNNPIGGFIIASQNWSRCAAQLPDDLEGSLSRYKLDQYRPFSELNGYFILVKSKGWILVTVWAILILLSRSKYFIYAYEKSNKALKYYYSWGNPILIYDGLVKNLDGMHGVHHERIELISKCGFARLYFRRLTTRIRKKLWNLF